MPLSDPTELLIKQTTVFKSRVTESYRSAQLAILNQTIGKHQQALGQLEQYLEKEVAGSESHRVLSQHCQKSKVSMAVAQSQIKALKAAALGTLFEESREESYVRIAVGSTIKERSRVLEVISQNGVVERMGYVSQSTEVAAPTEGKVSPLTPVEKKEATVLQ